MTALLAAAEPHQLTGPTHHPGALTVLVAIALIIGGGMWAYTRRPRFITAVLPGTIVGIAIGVLGAGTYAGDLTWSSMDLVGSGLDTITGWVSEHWS